MFHLELVFFLDEIIVLSPFSQDTLNLLLTSRYDTKLNFWMGLVGQVFQASEDVKSGGKEAETRLGDESGDDNSEDDDDDEQMTQSGSGGGFIHV